MANSKEQHKVEREKRIFANFATTLGLLPGGTVSSQQPPKPDILYRGDNGSDQAFELVEIVDEDYLAWVDRVFTTKGACYAFLDNLRPSDKNTFESLYTNADILLIFREEISQQSRKNALPKIFKYLQALPKGFLGEVVFKDVDPLACALRSLRVTHGDFCGPMFDVNPVTRVGNPLPCTIASKEEKKYDCEAPLHLLAYIDNTPMPTDDVLLGHLDKYLARPNYGCRFKKIFVYDCRSNTIKRGWPAA